jgi:hypothetical protein
MTQERTLVAVKTAPVRKRTRMRMKMKRMKMLI